MAETPPTRVGGAPDGSAAHADTEAAADPAAPRRSGRPRGPSSATEYAVLAAAWRVLTNEGITALTPTRLHAETGVARTTIYRHWPDASAVVADIVAGASQRRVPLEMSGDLRADLLAALETLTFRLRHRPVGALLAALLAGQAHAAPGSPTPGDYIGALIEPIRDTIAAGLAAGRLVSPPRPMPDTSGAPGSSATDTLLHELVGPLLLDVVLLGGDPDTIDDDAVIDRFLERHQARAAPVAPTMLRPDPGAARPVDPPIADTAG